MLMVLKHGANGAQIYKESNGIRDGILGLPAQTGVNRLVQDETS